VIVFVRDDVPNDADYWRQPRAPLTWRKPSAANLEHFPEDIVYATCSNGHTTRAISSVHSIAADGTMSPSYVCTIPWCTFHDFVRFEGWP
jgi:hypothetical protein